MKRNMIYSNTQSGGYFNPVMNYAPSGFQGVNNYMAYGGTDCYLSYHGQQNPIRLWTVDNNSILTKSDKEAVAISMI